MPGPGVLSSQICICFVTMSQTHHAQPTRNCICCLQTVFAQDLNKLNQFVLQSATSALRRRVLGVKGHSPAEQQHRLTHELSGISNTANGRADQAGEQELTDDPTTIVALLNVAGKLHTTSLLHP